MRQNHEQKCIQNRISESKHSDFGMDTNCSWELSLKWSSKMELKITNFKKFSQWKLMIFLIFIEMDSRNKLMGFFREFNYIG